MRSRLSCVWIRGWVGAFLVSCVGSSVVSHVSWITSLSSGFHLPPSLRRLREALQSRRRGCHVLPKTLRVFARYESLHP